MKGRQKHRFLCALLSILMIVSLLPTAALAAETEQAQADHVVINQAYGGGGNKGAVYTNDFIELYNPTDEDVSLDGWTIQYASKTGTFNANSGSTELTGTIKAHGYYLIQEAAGSTTVKDLPTPDAVDTIAMGGKEFKIALVNSREAIQGKDDATVVDFLGVGAADMYETEPADAISNSTAAIRVVDGVDTDNNKADFKAATPNPRNSAASGETPEPTTDPTPDPTPVPDPVTVKEALDGASGTEFRVKGVVTMVDGKNVYVQDATGGICLFLPAADSSIQLGDTVIGSGSRTEYNGLPELGSAVVEKSDGMTLSAKETTLGAITEADVCTYVTIKGLEVLAIDANNVTVQDAEGNSINIYKPVLGDKTLAVGDKLDFTGAVGYFKGFQLRNTVAEEIVVQADPYADIAENLSVYELTDAIADGDRILIVNTANNKTLTTEPADTYYLAGADVAPQDMNDTKIIALDNDAAEWTVAANENGTCGLMQGDNTLAGNREEYTDNSGKTKVRMNITLVATDSAEWKLVDFGESGVFLVNAGLESGKEGGNVSLEWYNGHFCLYDIYPGNEAKNSAACAVTFYKLVREKTVETPATPTAEPAAGEVAENTEVTFSCATEGAVISYSTDNGETWTEGTTYTVTEAVTLLVKAAKDGVESEAATFAYTIKDDTPEPTYNTIAEALAGAEGTAFTVKGVVTMVDGKNVYVQDETGGICLFLTAADSSIQLGDTVIGSGTRTAYRGLPELGSATVEKSSGMTLKAKQTTIGALTTADVCTYVQLKDLEVTEVYDNNGAYSAPNITLKDKDGATIQIYKAVVGKDADGAWAIKVGDKVDVYAAVGINNTTLQLRNTVVAEITPVVEVEEGLVTDLSTLKDGDTIVVYNPASGKAMSETDVATYYRAGVDATVTDDKISGYDSACVWTVGVKTEGDKTTYTFTSATGRVLTAGTRNSLPMGDANPDWTIEPAATEGCVYIRNAGRDTQYIEWYADKTEFSAYKYVAANEAIYARQL